MIKNCIICGKQFTAKTKAHVTCSKPCRVVYKKKKQKEKRHPKVYTKVCVTCGNSFETTYSTKLACSKECGDKYHKKHAKEHRTKLKNEKENEKSKNFEKNASALSDDALEARNLGVSYGMYVAMKYMEGQNERTKKVIRN